MATKEHIDILMQGCSVWNKWREENDNMKPDFSSADLSEIDLADANLVSANFKRANLTEANLWNADLTYADLTDATLVRAHLNVTTLWGAILRGANLSDVELPDANLFNANLSGANLTNADLAKAIFCNAELDGADFTNASVHLTVFGNNDLSTVKGLDTVKHGGPATIGIDTLYRSNGMIPESFLKGTGVPDNLIIYARSLIIEPISFYSCFISHSVRDKRFCERLYADLQVNGVRTWYFPEDAKWGETVWGEIDRSIKVYDKLIVVCSVNSLQSGPVLREIDRALAREDNEGKNILFPIRIDDYLFNHWQHERKQDVLRKVIGDFKGWSRSAAKYDGAFNRLLKALRAGDA